MRMLASKRNWTDWFLQAPTTQLSRLIMDGNFVAREILYWNSSLILDFTNSSPGIFYGSTVYSQGSELILQYTIYSYIYQAHFTNVGIPPFDTTGYIRRKHI